MKIYLCLLFILLSLSCDSNNIMGDNSEISGCTDSSASNYNPDATNDDNSCIYLIEGINQTIEATSFSQWEYYRFTDSSLNQVQFYFGNPDSSLNWDIAFQRNHIRTNSGTSGIANAGAYMDSDNSWTIPTFNNFNDDVENLPYSPDTLVNTFYDILTHTFSEGSANPILENWAVIDTLNNYTLNISNNKFIVKSASGEEFYKLWVFDYYNNSYQSGFISLVFNPVE